VFTTEVLVSLAAEGRLALTDPLQRFAPDGTRVPTFGAHRITLFDLATHSAALPHEMGQAPEGVNPRAWPTRDDRWTWLPGYALPWAPGTVAAYFNVGFDLLADAIEAAGGQPYPDLLRSRVTGPLGMKDTVLAPTPAWCTGLGCGRTHPNAIWGQAMQTEIGRPSSSMQLSACTATAISVARRWSVRERSPSPITCFHREQPRRERACCSLRPSSPCGRARRRAGGGGRAASARSGLSRSARQWNAAARPRPRLDDAGEHRRRCCLGRVRRPP